MAKPRFEADTTMREPSRSAKKRESLALQKLGEKLISLSATARAEMNLTPELLEALELYDRITNKEGARRQRQFIGKLMRNVDAQAIDRELQHRASIKASHLLHFKQIEKLRDELLQLPEAQLAAKAYELLQKQTAQDMTEDQLMELILKAREEKASGKNRGKRRELFRYLAKLQ